MASEAAPIFDTDELVLNMGPQHPSTHGVLRLQLHLEGERILLSTGSQFAISDDGGISWGEPFEGRDEKGDALKGSCASLVALSDDVLGLATMRSAPQSTNRYDTEMVFRTSADAFLWDLEDDHAHRLRNLGGREANTTRRGQGIHHIQQQVGQIRTGLGCHQLSRAGQCRVSHLNDLANSHRSGI